MEIKSDSLYYLKGEKVYVSKIEEVYEEYEPDGNNEGKVYITYHKEWDLYGPMWGSGESIELEEFIEEDPNLIEENFSDLFSGN